MPHAVDSGRAWLVLAASVITAGVTVGNALSLGTLFDYVEKYMHGSAGTISFLFALTVSLNFFVGKSFPSGWKACARIDDRSHLSYLQF